MRMEPVPGNPLRIAIRNLAGAAYPANRYRRADTQRAGIDTVLATRADILLLQEATGVGKPFALPEGWRMQPASALDRGSGSVVAAASHVPIDLSWRPSHRLLDAFGAYLDFGLLDLGGLEVCLASVHATAWRDEQWAATGRADALPRGNDRPWTSDAILDALVEAVSGREAILAGDWNEATNYPVEGDPGATAWFERARSAGLVEAIATTFGGPVRTNFVSAVKKSYQNDHVFLTSGLSARLRHVAVWNEPGSPVSDHAGIVVVLA